MTEVINDRIKGLAGVKPDARLPYKWRMRQQIVFMKEPWYADIFD